MSEAGFNSPLTNTGAAAESPLPQPSNPTLREMFTNAICYWEPRRILYNAVLVLVVFGHFYNSPLGLKEIFSSVNGMLIFFVLAVLANVCYCAAYAVDIFMQYSGLRDSWLQWRWVMLVLGLAFGATLAHFFSLGLTH
jgi:hypothetical protein